MDVDKDSKLKNFDKHMAFSVKLKVGLICGKYKHLNHPVLVIKKNNKGLGGAVVKNLQRIETIVRISLVKLNCSEEINTDKVIDAEHQRLVSLL